MNPLVRKTSLILGTILLQGCLKMLLVNFQHIQKSTTTVEM